VVEKLVDKSVCLRKANKMHLYIINLFQLNNSVSVSVKQVHHQVVLPVLAADNISYASTGCLAANTIRYQ